MSTTPKAPSRRRLKEDEVDATTRMVGKRIRAVRHQLGLSLDECADRTGIPAESLGRYERAEVSPTVRMLDRIATGLGVDPVVFLWGDPDRPPGVEQLPEHLRELVTGLVGRSSDELLRAKVVLFGLFAEVQKLRDPGSLG